MKKIKLDTSFLFLVLIAFLLAAGIVFAVMSFRHDPIRESLAGDDIINTLFVIENNASPLFSFVLMYHPPTRRAAVFDIPGSLGLILQRINRVDRIDSVYDPRRISYFVSEIERLLAINIAYSMVITLENLGRIVDLIQGVEIFIPSPVNEYHNGLIMFPSGLVRLDGAKAKIYVTYELPEESSELPNFRRQRFFMSFLSRLGEQNQFLNHPQVSRLFHSMVRSAANQRTKMRLFDEFARIDMSRVTIRTVGGTVREVSGQELLFPHRNGILIQEIVRQTQESLARPIDSFLADRTFTVEVLNGTTVTGLAGRTAELFRGFGYDVISIGNARRSDYDRTIIIARAGHEEAARIFGDIIRCENIIFDSPEIGELDLSFNILGFENRADFTIVLGRDFDGRFVTE